MGLEALEAWSGAERRNACDVISSTSLMGLGYV